MPNRYVVKDIDFASIQIDQSDIDEISEARDIDPDRAKMVINKMMNQ